MKDLIEWLILSTLLTLIMEIIRFQSVRKAFCFVKRSPRYALINLLIVSATLVPVFFMSRKLFFLSCVIFFWLFLSIVNAIVTFLRGYALMFSDIFLTSPDRLYALEIILISHLASCAIFSAVP